MSNLLNLFIPPEEQEERSTAQSTSSQDGVEIETEPSRSFELHDFGQSTEEGSVEIPGTSHNGPVYGEPDQNDPGLAYVDITEDESETSEYPLSPSSKRRKSVLETLFQRDRSEETTDDEEIQRNSKYTFTNTVVGSYRDELAQEMQREVQERKLLQKQKIEEAARENQRNALHNRRFKRTACVRRCCMRIRHRVKQQHHLLIFLAIMGFLTGVVGFAMELAIKLLEQGHLALTYTTDIWPVQFLLWTVYLYLILAVAVFSVRKISLCAMGSGIPEMKSILSGVTLVEYLSFRTLIAKVVGLSCAIGAGMVVGKEGPFVHTASIIANQLFHFPLFSRIRNSGPLRQQMFTCAIAAGVAGNFGAPIGGLLFSIEVTSTYYPVRNYFFSAWAAMFSGFTFRFLWNVRHEQPLFSAIAATAFTKESEGIVGISDALGSVVLGILGGLIGIFFIFLHLSIIRIRRVGAAKTWLLHSPYPYTIVVAGLTALLLFPELIGPYMAYLPIAAFKQLSVVGPLASEWTVISIWVSVPLFLLSRFWLTAFSISLPIPCGLFVPVVTVGAGVGRLFGELLEDLLGADLEPTGELAGIMAVVGAAAVGAGVTQTFSVAVIMFELTGQIILLVPVTITVVIAIAFSRTFSYNVYDGILKSRNLPYLPDIRTKGHSMRAVDIMDTSIVSNRLYLTRQITYRRLAEVMKATELSSFAVVDTEDNQTLLGIVSRNTLEEVMYNYRQVTLGTMPDDVNPSSSPNIDSNRSWHADVAKSIMTVTKAFNPFNSNSSNSKPDNHTTYQGGEILQDMLDGLIAVPYEYSPVQLQPSTPLTSIHLLFITLRLRTAFVTINGKLMGIITRDQIKTLIHDDSIFEWLME